MATVDVKVNAQQVLQNLAGLEQAFSGREMASAVGILAERMTATARLRAPFRFGQLRDSDFADPVQILGRAKFRARFGFAANHAKIMDTGWDVSEIRPRTAKALFIPLSRRAARQGPRGRNLIIGGQNPDAIFVKRVRTPKPKRGRRKGPNFYFTSTVEDYTRERSPSIALLLLARGADEILKSKAVNNIRRRLDLKDEAVRR